MLNDSALSATAQDSFMSYDTVLTADYTSLKSSKVDHRERPSLLTSSITELSQKLQLHSLQPQPLILPTKALSTTTSSRPTYLERKRSTTTHKHNQKRQHKPSLIRRQSSSAKISRLMALAQGLEISGYDALQDSLLQDESIPPLQIQTSYSSAHVDPLSMSSSMSSQRELESQGMMSSTHYHGVSGGSRPLGSGERAAAQKLVRKDIRLRTKWRGNPPAH